MPLREIRVNRTDSAIVADLWPGMFVKPTYEQEPTKVNPEIKADMGMVGGKLSPLKVYYPTDMDIEKIVDAADPFQKEDNLFAKTKHCPMCERKKREIIERLRNAMKEDGTPEQKYQRLLNEGDKIKQEMAGRADDTKKVVISSPPPIQQVSGPVLAQSPAPTTEEEKVDKEFIENMNRAISSMEATINKIINAPDEIVLPGE